MKTLIGITGYAGAGKDTLADAMMVDDRWAKIPLALPIKLMLNTLFDWPLEKWDDRTWKEAPRPEAFWKSPRELAQTLGTQWGRDEVSEELWTSRAIAIARRHPGPVVVPDVRFPNEAALIRENGGYVIRVERADVEPVAEHASEQYVSSITPDVRVFNNQDIDTLRKTGAALARLAETGLLGNDRRY